MVVHFACLGFDPATAILERAPFGLGVMISLKIWQARTPVVNSTAAITFDFNSYCCTVEPVLKSCERRSMTIYCWAGC
jgi:hypothetical protein